MIKVLYIFLFNLLFALVHPKIVVDRTDGAQKLEGKCNEELPNLSVGDFHISNGNYVQFKKQNKLFVLGISDSACPECCSSEPILFNLHEDFLDKVYTFQTKKKKGIQIQIARADFQKKLNFIGTENLSTSKLPAIFVYFDGTFYPYENSQADAKQLLHFINRLLHPVVPLVSKDEVLAFFNNGAEHIEKTRFLGSNAPQLGKTYAEEIYKTRAIVFIYNKGDYNEELNSVKLAGRSTANRINLRLGFVTDAKLIKHMKQSETWFGEASFNTLILKRYDGDITYLDLLQFNVVQETAFWINKKSVKDVEELTQQLFLMYNHIGQAIMMCYVDFKALDKDSRYASSAERSRVFDESNQLVAEVLPQVAKNIFKAWVVTYADVTTWGDNRGQFGIDYEQVPACTFQHPKWGRFPVAEGHPLGVEELTAHSMGILKGTIKGAESAIQEVKDTSLIKKLEKHIGELITTKDYGDEVHAEGTDAAVLIFASSVTDAQQTKYADEFIDCKQRFKRIRNRSVRFYAIDINKQYSLDLGVQMNNVPFLLVYPAFHKTTQVYKYAGEADAVEMAKFIHKNAEIKFELKEKFFGAKGDPTSDAVMMEMGQDGNIAPSPEQIAELQAKQDNQEAQKAAQMQEVEDELKRRGEL